MKTIEEIQEISKEDLVALYFMAQSEVENSRKTMQKVRQEAIDLKLETEFLKNSDVVISEEGCLHMACCAECQKEKLTFNTENELVNIECDNNECVKGNNYLHEKYNIPFTREVELLKEIKNLKAELSSAQSFNWRMLYRFI